MFGSSNPFGSSSPFGSSPTNPFGASSSNPFGGQPSNPFGAKPAFGSTPFGQSTGGMFGSSATGVFGQTQPAFGSTTPAFGASSTPAFGSTPTFGAGSTAFGQQKPAFGGFGATPTAQANPFGTTFGQTQSAFGGTATPATPAFGSTTPYAFGTSVFGGGSTPAFGAASTPAFGASSAPAFGTTTSAFGATPAASPFGATTAAPAFGTTTPAFGTTAFGTTAFGGAQRVGTRVAPYAVTNDTDSGSGVGGQQMGKFMSISAMPAYKNKCVEELRWEDYQAGDKGGPSAGTQAAPSGANIFGATTPASPFGGTTAFGAAATVNPFGASTTPSLFGSSTPAFGATTTPAFGASSTPAFGAAASSPFGAPATTPAFGATTTPAFGATATPAFGASATPAFGTTAFGASAPAFGATSVFGAPSQPAFGATPASTPAFGTSLFGATTTPAFGATSSPFGGSSLFGSTPASGSFFGAGASTPAFGASTPAFGATSASAFGAGLFGSSSASAFGGFGAQTKPAGLTQSTPAPLFGGFGSSMPTQSAGGFFGGFGATQPGSTPSLFGAASTPAFGQSFQMGQPQQQPPAVAPAPVSSPFGVLPAMPQISIGRAPGSPSIQYGISSIPVSDKPAQMRTTSLLTPRHITPRSKVRMHARRYHPKKDGPKVSFFSDGDDLPSTPKADVLFVPRENPRALFIRQPEQSPVEMTPSKSAGQDFPKPASDAGRSEMTRAEDVTPPSAPPLPDYQPSEMWTEQRERAKNGVRHESPPFTAPGTASPGGVLDERFPEERPWHRDGGGNGYISLTGHRAGEAAIAYEHGADIEALMPRLRQPDYYTEPRLQELAAKERADPGYTQRVKDFTVGRRYYGSVRFLGETDVRRLDLESIVQLNKCEVVVYPDDSKKPAVGQGLNKPAEVTLLQVRLLDKKTGATISEGPEVEKFERKLRKKTEDQGAEFISYDSTKCEWKFRVKHFSRYGLDDDSEEEQETPLATRRSPRDDPGGSVQDALPAQFVCGEAFEGPNRGSPADGRGSELADSRLTLHFERPEEENRGDEGQLEQGEITLFPAGVTPSLTHSLPAQLGLDPVRVQQMKDVLFAGSEDDDGVSVGGTRQRYNRVSVGGRRVSIHGAGMNQARLLASVSDMGGATSAAQKRMATSVLTAQEVKNMRTAKRAPHASLGTRFLRKPVPMSATEVGILPITGAGHKRASSIGISAPSSQHAATGSMGPSLLLSPEGLLSTTREIESSPLVKRRRADGGGFETTDISGTTAAGKEGCVTDAALFMGHSFRVGWGPGGLLVHNGNVDHLSSVVRIEKVPLDLTVRGEDMEVKDALKDLQFKKPLELHLRVLQTEDGERINVGQPPKVFSPKCTREELGDLCDGHLEILKSQEVIAPKRDKLVLRHQAMVWGLTKVLFAEDRVAQVDALALQGAWEEAGDVEAENMEEGDEQGRMEVTRMEKAPILDKEGEIFKRRANFSGWLQESVEHLVKKDMVRSPEDSMEDADSDVVESGALWAHMSGCQLEDAVEKAVANGDVRLACLLSCAGGSLESRQDIKTQLEVWSDEDLHISRERLRLYQILAGDVKAACQEVDLDWKRFLGLLMWYSLSANTPLQDIVENMWSLVNSKVAPSPIPMWIEEGIPDDLSPLKDEGFFDIAWYLMLNHAGEATDEATAAKMFRAQSSTFDPLDTKLVWHLYTALVAAGVLDNMGLHALHTGFASQLLSAGVVKEALYVLMHTPPVERAEAQEESDDRPIVNEKALKEVLELYVESWDTPEMMQTLQETLGLPAEWLSAAKAAHAKYMGDVEDGVVCLMESSQWVAAHSLFVSALGPRLLLDKRHEELWSYIERLDAHRQDIGDWETGGNLFLDYMQLASAEVTELPLDVVCGRCDSLLRSLKVVQESQKASLAVSTRVVYSEMASSISAVLLAVTREKAGSSTVELKAHNVTLSGPLPEDLLSCRIQVATAQFSLWLGEAVV